QGRRAEHGAGEGFIPGSQCWRDDLGDEQQHHEFERRELAELALAERAEGERQQDVDAGDADHDFHRSVLVGAGQGESGGHGKIVVRTGSSAVLPSWPTAVVPSCRPYSPASTSIATRRVSPGPGVSPMET